MAHSLYEGLRAVGLQHHYDRLTTIGVRRLAHLMVLTLEDFPLLGIQTMQDRTRLFHLIQTLKMLDSQTLQQAVAKGEGDTTETSDWTADHTYECTNTSGGRMSSVCRKLDFSSESELPFCPPPKKSDDKEEPPQSANSTFKLDCIDSVIFPGNHTKVLTKAKQLGADSAFAPRLSPSKQNSKTTSRSKSAKEEVTPQRYWTSGKEDKTCACTVPIYQSNTSEYNYGLPQTSAPATPSRRSEGDPRIWVCVRKRPLTAAEERRGEANVVSTPDDKCVIVHESKEAVDLTQYVLQHRFYFDHVFDKDCSNEDVYLQTAYPLVQHMLKGGSATCFAYGQTGAGKTHTMLGSSPRGSGLYALAVRDIFTHLSTSPALAPLSVFASFFEIYCGQLYDLLDQRKRLFAREDGQRTVHIAGLCHVRVDSVRSLLEVIWRGTEERSQGNSGVNPLSSRSHAMLQIQLRDPHQNIYGRMWFVDLAGSERASDSRDPDRQSRMEGAEINQSLLALKECIRSLDQEQSHTPFRQSKLTQVLRDSFVGDSMTCMIANISPVHSATEHTLNTLRYADRVKELRGQGTQWRRRRSKNAPSPKQNMPQSLSRNRGDNRWGLRGKSPPKKPKRNGPVPTTLSPMRTHKDGAFLSSTPKSSVSREEGTVRRLFQIISPVKSPPNQAKNTLQSHRETEKLQFKMNEKARCNQANADEWTLLGRNVQDQEKRRHLKLYHQQLQQFAPLMSNQQALNSSAASSGGHLCATENMMESAVEMEDILSQYRARVNQTELAFPYCKASLGLKDGKNSNTRVLSSEGTKVLLSKNATQCDRQLLHEGKKSHDGEARWAWETEKAESLEKECVATEPCNMRAPAERPLSPVTDHSDSILTLTALGCSPLQITSPKHSDDNGCTEKLSTTSQNMETQIVSVPQEESSVMEPIRLSMLVVEQRPATESFLQSKLQMDGKPSEEDAVIPVCVEWEQESTEESYLEVPQGIGASRIPAAIRLHSQQRTESRALEATESVSLCSIQPTSALNDLVPYTSTQNIPQNIPHTLNNNSTVCLLAQMNTATLHGHSGNITQSERGEERRPPHPHEAQWHIVQAHLESLKEMEILSHKEGTLLIQQPDMAFVEYVEQLEDIMRRNAVCVRSMIAHLQPYLKSNHPSVGDDTTICTT